MIVVLVVLVVLLVAALVAVGVVLRRRSELCGFLAADLNDTDARLTATLDALEEVARVAAPMEWLESVMSKRITVHLVNDMTVEGSLAARMDDGIVLRAAVLLDGSAGGTAMAGETWLARDKVLMAQLDA